MSNLLTCVSEPTAQASCCDEPYLWLQPDCVRVCLIRRAEALRRSYVDEYESAGFFGLRLEDVWSQKLQDIQLLVDLLHQLFLERVATITGTGIDPGVAYYWDSYKLSCVQDYFACRHSLDLRPFFLDAAVYDPTKPPVQNVLDSLPVPYLVPCGDPIPDTPPVPPFYPPGAAPCLPDVTASIAVDIADIATTSVANIAGERYLMVYNLFGASSGEQFDNFPCIVVGTGVLDTWTYEPVADGDVVLLTSGDPYFLIDLWIGSPGAITPYYPLFTAEIDTGNLTLTHVVGPPYGNDVIARDVIIQGTTDGTTWIDLYQVPETVLNVASPGFGAIADTIIDVRIQYLGECPGTTDVDTTVILHPPRSFLMSSASANSTINTQSANNMKNAFPLTEWSFGAYVKWNGSVWGNSGNQWSMGFARLFDSTASFLFELGLYRTNAFSGQFWVDAHVVSADLMTNFYLRQFTINGMAALMDGNWHTIVVSKSGLPYSFEMADITVMVDSVIMGTTSQASIGVIGNINPGWFPPGEDGNLDFGLSKGTGLTVNPSYFDNVFRMDRAMTPADVNNIVYPGAWFGPTVDPYLKALWTANEPDVTTLVAPYIGSQLVGGGIGQAVGGGVVFSTDIPPGLLFP